MDREKQISRKRKMRRVDNPCKYCDKANMNFVNDCEYGCDNPCEKAKDFWKQVGNKLGDLLDKCQQLLRNEDEEKW